MGIRGAAKIMVVAMLVTGCSGSDSRVAEPPSPSQDPPVQATEAPSPAPNTPEATTEANDPLNRPAPKPEGMTPLASEAWDAVPDAVAELPIRHRVNPYGPSQVGEPSEAPSPDGVWVMSKPLWTEVEPIPDDAARYRHGYSELLLLSADRTKILAAYPMLATSITWIDSNDEAVYFGRNGDGGQPISVVARLDREQTHLIVKFAAPSGVADGVDAYVPRDDVLGEWEQLDVFPRSVSFRLTDDGVEMYDYQATSPTATLDAETLQPLD